MHKGKELKIKRIILDIKATDIAKELGVHKSYISLMETGRREIPLHIYRKWNGFLNVKSKIN